MTDRELLEKLVVSVYDIDAINRNIDLAVTLAKEANDKVDRYIRQMA